ncbi:MAG: hypothetical protein A2096_02945 [Spirochaetes bacterium GWF1_41_5]|nr:MAG: hypothetical protein A2096_02945 [Spirochaetes bacterium GWF1_41_5]
MEIIILSGGLGTRLQKVVSSLPKPMAPVNGKPFLWYLLNYIGKFNISKIIFSIGYKSEIIRNFFGRAFNGIPLVYSVENEPLGTGGAIKKALARAEKESVLVQNGDTFFCIDYNRLFTCQQDSGLDAVIALKCMPEGSRYGAVLAGNSGLAEAFIEKGTAGSYINGGIYCLKKSALDAYGPEKFSIEKDYFPVQAENKKIGVSIFSGYFIDIGIPADYSRAQNEYQLLEQANL